MSRPEILFALFASPEGLPGVGAKTLALLERLGLTRVRDLLFHAPERLVDRRVRPDLKGARDREVVTVPATFGEHRPGRTKNQPYRVVADCAGTALEIVHFRTNADWMRNIYPEGERRIVSGRLQLYDGRWQMAHPDHVLAEDEAASLAPFEPVYPLTEGLTQKALARSIAAALARMPTLAEWHDGALLAERGWPALGPALEGLHRPQESEALAAVPPARARLAYDELLSHQLALQLARAHMRRGRSRPTVGEGSKRALAEAAFGYAPTGAQVRARDEILADMGREQRMMRLLQGDVGAGKTWVAAMALLTAAEAGGQGALMAPTEILARQHAVGLAPVADAAGVSLTLLTGRDKGAERADKLDRIADGRAGIVIGTHALLQPDVAFDDLRLVVIDEQHRFGVRQRMDLAEKTPAGTHMLIMTATPIPRTLALAGFGDLDISVLDEKPPGRRPVDTRLIPLSRLGDVIARLKAAIDRGSRAYWVCPAVEDNEESPLISVEQRHRVLAGELGAERVVLVHGQMPGEAKDSAMRAFQEGRAQVLVATTVIEVGVDVPEATIMVIEQADSFGLAQLHQLRGRVGRGPEQSHCLLLYPAALGEAARARLTILRETEDGFRLAEEDLRLRGAGDMIGHAQSGLPKFRIADPERDRALMERARDDARMALHGDPGLESARGQALKVLLYLMDRDRSVRLLKSG